MFGHELSIEKNMTGVGFDGYCECSDYDYEDGWSGGVFFYGDTKDEVRDYHFDHMLDAMQVAA